MKGYGRGYYGEEQLAPSPPRRRGGGWVKIAIVVGVGAVVWFMWPRSPKPEHDFWRGGDEPKPPAPPQLPSPEGPSTQVDPLDQVAQSRGYPSQQAYEDAVVASARQLQDAGAQVSFASHLQHLTPRLGP